VAAMMLENIVTQKSAAGVGDLVVISNAAVAADSIVVEVADAVVAVEAVEEVNKRQKWRIKRQRRHHRDRLRNRSTIII